MDPRILIPVDDSPTARQTIKTVIELKEQFPQTITLLNVINEEQLAYRMIPDFQLDMVKENAQKNGKNLLNKYASQLSEHDYVVDTRLEIGSPRTTITSVANDEPFQLVIVGRHEGSGEIRDVLFGSVANYVLHNVKCPVLLF